MSLTKASSGLIEGTARAILKIAPDFSGDEASSAAQAARGKDLMRNLIVGGALVGTGTGVGVSLLNYIKSIRAEAEADDSSRLNDDTLYMPLGKSADEKSNASKWLAPGLAVTGGVLTAGASYALVRKVAEGIERRRRLKLLDEAQQETLTAVDAEAEARKSANAQMTLSDALTAAPIAMPLLAALAAGGVSYAALRKAFPVVKRKKLDGPRKIKFVDDSGNVVSEEDVEKAANEFLLLLVDAVSAEKTAGDTCLTTEVLNFVAEHGKEAGMLYEDSENFYDDIAQAKSASIADKMAAARLIQTDERLAVFANSTAAAEFADRLPNMFKVASEYAEDQMQHIVCIGALQHIDMNRPMLKNASAMLQQQIDERNSGLSSDATGSAGEDMEDSGADGDITQSTDPVDGIMLDMKQSPIAPQ